MASISFLTSGKLSELLSAADPKKGMYVRVLSTTKLALGTDPLKPTTVIDLAREKVEAIGHAPDPAPAPIPAPANSGTITEPSWRSPRGTGEYWFELKGRRTEGRSLKEVLSGGLLAVENAAPGTLEKLSNIKLRSRRIVARDPKLLFDQERLARDHAEKLGNGWFFGTNNSAYDTNRWLQRACECAGLVWEKDFKTSMTFTLDDAWHLLEGQAEMSKG